jgi:hypothetical protein
VIDHHRVSVFDATDKLFFVVGTKHLDTGQIAQNALLRFRRMGEKIGNDNFVWAIRARHEAKLTLRARAFKPAHFS